MPLMPLIHVTDFDSWRAAARQLLCDSVPPEDVAWRGPQDRSGQLPLEAPYEPEARQQAKRPKTGVPREFVRLAEAAACHRSPARWALLYRVLWRLTHGERLLLEVTIDDDVRQLNLLAKQVRCDVHRMHSFLRFQRVEDEAESAAEPHYVAWYEPDHLVLRRAAPFFVERFGTMPWAILTPDDSCYWDQEELRFGPGAPKPRDLKGDPLEKLWKQYYASTFQAARVNPRLLDRELPRRFWRNLPEAELIDEMVRRAPAESARDKPRADEDV
ncbi:MAG: TIGR03915 family putative DNA repair protein [Planctomycetota bacterium]